MKVLNYVRFSTTINQLCLTIMLFSGMAFIGNKSYSQTTVFTDDFNRGSAVSPMSNGGTPTMTYTTASTASTPGVSSANLTAGTDYALNLQSAAVAGITYVTGPLSTYSSPFATTLANNSGDVTWTFNMRTNRTTVLSGFASSGYVGAVVLGSTSSNLASASASGYLVSLYKGTTNNAIRLSSFTGGLTAAANVTAFITSADLATNTAWASVKVVYTPSTNTWKLYVRDDATAIGDPTTVTTQSGVATVNTAFTSSALTDFGFYWNHSTATPSSNTGRFDNFKVVTASSFVTNPPTVSTNPTSSITATTAVVAGNVSNNGGLTLIRRGLIYSTGTITDINSTTGGGLVTDAGTGTGSYSANLTGLTNNTSYNVKAFAENSVGISYGSNQSFTTLQSDIAPTPAAQPTNYAATSVTCSGMTINWTAATSIDGYLVLRTAGTTTPNTNPSNTFTYTAGATLGNATVVYVGSGNSVAQSSLTDNTAYSYTIYSYNGTGAQTSYLTASPLTGTTTTLSVAALTATAAANVYSNTFTANWTGTAACATSYNMSLNATENFENSLSLFTAVGGVFSSGTNTGGSPSSAPLASSGTYGYFISNGTATLTSKAINTNAVTSPSLSFKLSALSYLATGNGIDAGDYLYVDISPDNGTTWYSTMRVNSSVSNGFWAFGAAGTASTPYDGDVTAAIFSGNGSGTGIGTVQITGLPNVSQLRVRIQMINNAAAEAWVIDDFKIGGTVSVTGNSLIVNNPVSGALYNYAINSVAPNSTATSNVISVSVPAAATPSIDIPTVNNITTNSAAITVNVLNLGSTASISARGTVYKTSAGVTATDNALAEGNTTTGSFTQTRSLSPQTHYYVKGYATNAEGVGLSSEVNFFTLSNPPVTQASALSATPFSSTQIDLSWVAADFPSSGATIKRYLLLRATAPNMPIFTGTNGFAPTVDANTTIVNADISDLSSSASANGLSQTTDYNFMLIPFTWNGTDNATISYLTIAAPTTSGSTSESTPALLNNPTATDITNNSAILGANIVSDGGVGIADRGTVYNTSSPVIISNNTLSEGGFDLGTFSHLRTDLLPQTKYYFAGYAVNNAGSLSLSNEASFYTYANPPVANASNLIATGVTGAQINLSWNSAVFPTLGATFTRYILLRADYPNVPTITNGNGQAPVAGLNTTIVNAAILGTATTASSSGLTGSTRYNYVLIPYTWDGVNTATYNYLITGAPSADGITLAPIPTSQPFSLSFSNVSCSGMTLTWRKASSLPDGYIAIRSSGAIEPITDPTPGVVYSIGNTINNATVVYIGSDSAVVLSSLINTTQYNYKIFSYNGSGSNISYNIITPLKGSQITSIPSAPIATAATGISLTQVTANWNAEACANNGYKLDVSTFPNFYNPTSGTTSLALESFENSLSLFTASGTGASYFSGNSPTTNKPPATAGGTYPYATTGTYAYGVANGTNVLTSNDINTAGFEAAELSFRLAAFSYASTSNGLDATDLVKVEISPDGGSTWLNTLIVTGNNNAYWGYDATGIATTPYDGDNNAVTFIPASGNNLTTGYSTINISNLPNVAQLKVRITMTNGTSELWVIDNFTVSGRTASYVAPYNNYAVAGTSQVLSGLTSNTTYYYRVRANGNGTTSLNSNTISATPESGYATVNTPTVTSITSNSAVLGATVVNTGSDVSISARGTVYKTATGVTATDNALAEGGTTVSAFTHTRSGLSAQTRYYFKGYATNSFGTGISSEASFFTLSNPATSAATSFTATPFSSDEINLAWSAASFPTSGATVKGYVILRALYPNVPSLSNSNGQAPAAGSNTSIVTTSLSSTATATSATGLNSDTRYNFIIIPYTWDGTNEATYNYYTTNAPLADANTLIPVTALPPTNLSVTTITCNGMTIGWTPGTGADGTIVLQTSGSSVPNTNPAPNVFYTVGSVIGNATVAYVGSGSSFTLSSLLDNTNYNFKLISYNATGTDIGYLTASPLNASQSTLSAATPVANNATNTTSTSFTASWNPISCATNYLLYAYTNNTSNIVAWTFPTLGTSAFSDSSQTNATNLGNNRFSLSSGSISDVSGNTTRSASGTTWALNKCWQVITNTTGYTSIKVSSVQYSSASGPRDFKIQYKIRAAGAWTDVTGGNIIAKANYTSGVLNNLLLPAACDNTDSLYLRWICTSTYPSSAVLDTGALASGGTSRIDDIYVRGNLVQYVSGYNGLSVNSTSANVTGLSVGSQYYYHVKAVGTSGGQTAISNVVPVTTYYDIATADFRTKSSGNFNDANIWEYKYNATSYTNATAAPASTNNIAIRSVDSVNLNTDFVINSGKSFTDSGKINMNSFVISGAGSCKILAGATMYTANTNGIYSSTTFLGSIITTSRTFDAAANYVFNGTAAQSAAGLPSPITGTTTIANAAGVSLNANKTVTSPGSIVVASNGKLLFGTGVSTSAYSINGTGSFTAQSGATLVITNSQGICAPGTPTVADTLGTIRLSGLRTFAANVNYEISKNDGVTKSNLGGSFGTEITSINNLTINNPKGVSLSSSNVTVNGTLSLVSGKLTTNAYKVTIGALGSVTKSDTSWVIGNLEKNIATGTTSATFEIGLDSLNYTPATIAFGSVTTAGKLMVADVSGAHPNIASSILSNTKRLNFYTKLTGTGIVFNNYNATVNFNNPANLVGSANPTTFISGIFDGGWSYPTMGTLTTTSSRATGITSFGDLAFAEAGCTIAASASSNSPICAGRSIQLSGSTTGANGVVGYNWNGPAGFTASVQNPVITNASSLNAGVYSLTTTDALGCTSSTTTTVVVNAVPVAGITNNTGATELTCAISAISVTATGGTSYSWNNSLGNNAAASITSAGIYTVTATSNGCSSTESITITEDKTLPTAGIDNNTGSTQINCATPSISVTATGGVSYSWNNGLGNNADAIITSAGTYTVTVTGANGCTSTSSITVTSNTTLPTASITNNTGTTVLTCAVSSISVTANGGISYSWSNGLGNNANAAITAAGTYTVTVTGANGCSSTASITVTSNTSAQTAGITNNSGGATELNCVRSSISVTATGGGTYSWNNGLGSNASQTITAPGVYVVTVTGTNGCTSSASISITSNTTAPTASIDNNTNVSVLDCNTTSISLSANGGGTYSWNNGLGTIANQTITNAGTYTVTVTGANGCTATASTVITANTAAPSAGITNNTGATELNCTRTSISVLAAGGDSYSWSNGLGAEAAQVFTSAGTYTVTVTGANGCTATASITVTSNTTAPIAAITNNTGVTELTCAVTSISVTATGGGTYSWNNGLGNNASATITAPGTYAVLVTGANGCTADDAITITADKFAPNASITNNTGSNVITCSTPVISVTAADGVSYSWNNGLGNNANASITAAGTYTVTVTGANGCTSTSSITITSNTTSPTAGIVNNTGTNVITCSTPSISVTATGGVSYSWNNGLGNSDNATITSAGTYTVTVTGANGCTSTSSIIVTSNTTAPGAGITNNSGTSVLTCSTLAINVTATGNGTYSWNNGLGDAAAATITSAGTYTVTVTGANGCVSSSSITVTSNTIAPIALIINNTGSVQITCTTPSISVTATGSGTYSWNNGLGNNATAVIISAGTYVVTVTGSNGCTATDDITVTSNTTAPTASITNNSATTVITCSTPEINLTATGNGTYLWNNNLGDNANATASSAGIYTVTVTGANGCTTTSSVTITSNTTAPLAAITNNTGTTVLNCLTSSISVTATGGVSYSWNNGLGNNANATITSAGTYTVTVTGSNGCTSTASVTVTSNSAVPVASINNNTGSTVLTCAVTSINVTATGGGTYSWNNGLGNNATVNISAPGTYTVTVTGASGCTSTASVVVTVGPGVPTVGYTATATSVCAGTAVTLIGTGADTYTWTGGITNGVSFVPTATTTYTVTGTENIGGCSNTASVTITVNPKPTGVISGTTSICTGAAANLSIAVTGNGPWSGNLSDGTAFSGSTNPITVSVSPVANTTYTIASLTASSCSASSVSGSATVSVNNFTVDSIVGSRNACIYTGTTSTLNATYSIAATNASGYAWTLPTGATLISGAGTNTINVHYASTFTTGTISVAVSSACGTPVTKTAAITKTVSAAPATLTGPASVCAYIGTTTQATYTSGVVTGAIKYSWTLPSTVTIVSATSDSSSINVTFGVAYVTSTFSVKAVVGCGTTAAKTLSVAGTTTAPTAGTAPTRCGAGLVSVSATPGAGETIDWYSAATAGILLRSGSLTFDSTYTTTGVKTVYAVSRSTSNGCVSATRTAVTATINALPTAVTVSVSASSCGNAALTLSATAPASTTLSWFADSSTTGTVLATGTSFTTPVLSATTKYFIASQSTTGCYAATLKSATGTINAVPGLPTVATTQSRCGAGSITLTATAPAGSAVWFRDATITTALTTATTATVTYATPATSASDSTYYVASKSTAGCFSLRTAVLAKIVTAVNPPLAVNASRCGAGNITVSATPGAGETIDWYSAATAGTLLRSGSLTLDTNVTTANKTFYAAARNTTGGCVSATRTAVVATYNALPTAVTVSVNGSSCGSAAVTLSATAPANTTLSWFADSSTIGTVLATGTSFTTPVLSATTKYFVASQSAAGCYAAILKSATATINAVPALPTVNTTQSRCGTGAIVLTATAPTGSAVWFRDATTATALTTATTATVTYSTPATSAADSTYYVASKATTGCFSARTAVLAKINAVPAAPTTTGTSVCGAARATVSATTTVAGGTIDWYSATTAGTLLRSNSLTFDSLITATRTFYALTRVTTTGCVSATRTAAVATFNALLAAPTTLTGTTSICPILGAATGTTYTTTAVATATSYLWTIPSGAAFDTVVTNGLKVKVRFLTASSNDSITVQAVGTTGCAGTKKVLKLVTTGCATSFAKSATPASSMNVNVFPNPTTSNFNVQVITAGNESIKVRVLDIQGRQIKSITINPYETISIGAELKAGSYIIEVRQGKNIKTTRILKF